MLKIYNTDIETNKIEEIKEFKKGSWISLVNPSENEIKKVCENVKIQEDFIRDALDFEEKARIDNEEDDGTTLFVVDVPIIEKSEENDVYTTMPLGTCGFVKAIMRTSTRRIRSCMMWREPIMQCMLAMRMRNEAGM